MIFLHPFRAHVSAERPGESDLHLRARASSSPPATFSNRFAVTEQVYAEYETSSDRETAFLACDAWGNEPSNNKS